MSRLLVMTAAYYPDLRAIERLRLSCIENHVKLMPYKHQDDCCRGLGWSTVGSDTHAQFVDLPKVIRNTPAEFDTLLFTDSADVFVVADEDEILSKYNELCPDGDLLMAAEPGLYPPHLHDVYDKAYPNSLEIFGRWRYQNGGGFIAGRDRMLEILNWNCKHYTESEEAMYRWLHCLCDNDAPPMRLDNTCQIFQAMSGGGSDVMEWGRRPMNRETESFPIFLHWNGRLGGIEEAYWKVYS